MPAENMITIIKNINTLLIAYLFEIKSAIHTAKMADSNVKSVCPIPLRCIRNPSHIEAMIM